MSRAAVGIVLLPFFFFVELLQIVGIFCFASYLASCCLLVCFVL